MVFDGRARILVLAAFCLLFFLLNASTFNALGMVLPYMVADLQWNWAAAGLGFTLLGVACGLSSIVPAILARHIGVSRTLLLGSVILASGFLCFGLARTPVIYYAGAILIGTGFSLCGSVPSVHVISNSFQRSSTAIGVYFTVGGLGAVAGPLLVQANEALTGNWRVYWIAVAAISLLLGIYASVAAMVKRSVPQSPEDVAAANSSASGWSARAALRSPAFYAIVAAYSIFLLLNTTIHSFAAQHIAETGFDLDVAAALLAVAAVISAAGSMVAGIAGEKVGARHLALLSLGAIGVGTLALAISGSWIMMVVFVLGFGIGLGFCFVSTVTLLIEFFGKRANLELYSVMCVISTLAAIGPAVGGSIRDATGGFGSVFAGIAALGFVFMLVLLKLKRPEMPPETGTVEEYGEHEAAFARH